jgi:ParB family chromosome partitioning protein
LEIAMNTSIESLGGELMLIPLSLLIASPRNVRQTNGRDVSALKASIKAQGLLQNLIVCPQITARGRHTGLYEVVGGQRRLRALLSLSNAEEIAPDEEILCRVKPDREAAEASLAENTVREAMHPADEFQAFHRLVSEGRSVEKVAMRFGVSPLVVKRRLKLAALHPNLIALYRQDEMTIDQLMALALSDDPEEQWRVWTNAPHWRRDAEFLRASLVNEERSSAHDPMARLVGLEAYEAAGGRVRRDLFSEDGGGYIEDPELLDRLAMDRLQSEAEAVRAEGWSWVDVVPRLGSELYRFGRCRKSQRRMTKAEVKQHKALSKEVERLQALVEAQDSEASGGDVPENQGGEGAAADYEEALTAAEDALRTYEESLCCFDDEAYQVGGAIVCVGRGGEVEVHRGLIRPSVRPRAASAAASGDAGQSSASGTPQVEKCRPVHSAPLMLQLTGHRTLAARAALLERPELALCALLECLVGRLFSADYGGSASPVRLSLAMPDAGLMLAAGGEQAQGRAMQCLEAQRQAWGDRIPGDSSQVLSWLVRLPETSRMELLSLCVALTLNDVRDSEEAGSLDALCSLLQLDMADWWTATADGYFNRVSKDAILAAVTEGAGADAAARMRGMSKAELARVAVRELEGKRWLPNPLRRRSSDEQDKAVSEEACESSVD